MDKHWQGRFTKVTQNEVEAFTASIFFDVALLEEDIQGSLAHVKMLGKVGILTEAESEEIQKGLHQVLESKTEIASSDEDIHMKVESELKKHIGLLAGKLHTARSRNDQVALDLHLYLRKKIVGIMDLLKKLCEALLMQAKAHPDVVMPGYTHLQRAQPILFANHLLAYVAMVLRDIERLQESWKRINQLPLGACALAGTGFPIDRQMVADFLQFDDIYDNSLDAVSDRDFCVEFLANASLIMVHLSRLSEEIILWCSQEFDFIELDDAYCTGSSIMPQKKNPDVPELVRGKAGRVIGSLMGTLSMLKGLPLAYNKDMQEDKEAIFDTVKTLEGALSVYVGLITTLSVHKEKMLQAAKEGFLNATELADCFTRNGMAFREAHHTVGKLVRHCLDNNCELEEVCSEEIDVKQIAATRNFPLEIQFDKARAKLEALEQWFIRVKDL